MRQENFKAFFAVFFSLDTFCQALTNVIHSIVCSRGLSLVNSLPLRLF